MAYANSKPQIVKYRKTKFVGPPKPNSLATYRYRQRYPERARHQRQQWREKNRHVAHAHSHISTLRCRYPDVSENISREDLSAWILEHRGNNCIYCGDIAFHIDHKMPLSKNGEHDLNNIQMICATCNRAKNDMTDDEYRLWIARLKAKGDVS